MLWKPGQSHTRGFEGWPFRSVCYFKKCKRCRNIYPRCCRLAVRHSACLSLSDALLCSIQGVLTTLCVAEVLKYSINLVCKEGFCIRTLPCQSGSVFFFCFLINVFTVGGTMFHQIDESLLLGNSLSTRRTLNECFTY